MLYKKPPAQFGKILARTPSQPLLFLPKPVVSGAPLVVAGISSLASIPSRFSGLTGEGLTKRRISRGWGRETAPAPLLSQDPGLRSRSEGRASSRAPETNASARARSLARALSAQHCACPSPRPGRPTPYYQGAPRFGHPTLCLGIPTPSVTRALDTQRPVHPEPGRPTLLCTVCQKTPAPRLPHA